MKATTPASISEAVLRLRAKIGVNSEPVFVPVKRRAVQSDLTDDDDTRLGNCLAVLPVARVIDVNTGQVGAAA